MNGSKTQIKEQAKFCKELAVRLEEFIERNTGEEVVTNYTQINNDIVRLRRELNILHNYLKW